jgi:hypothetical protein
MNMENIMAENPFKIIVRNFPFGKKLEICEPDLEKLIDELVIDMTGLVTKYTKNIKYYNTVAADVIMTLDEDYGVEAAAEYWRGICIIKGSKWGKDFMDKAQDIIVDIYREE